MKVVDEIRIGIGRGNIQTNISQLSPIDELTCPAAWVVENGENGGNGPEPEPASLWWLWLLLGVGGSAVVAARIKKALDQERRK